MSKWKLIDHGTSIDVVPVDEEHAFGDECTCQPLVEQTDGIPMISHNSATEVKLKNMIQEYAIDYHNSFKSNYPSPDLNKLVSRITNRRQDEEQEINE